MVEPRLDPLDGSLEVLDPLGDVGHDCLPFFRSPTWPVAIAAIRSLRGRLFGGLGRTHHLSTAPREQTADVDVDHS